MRKFLTFVILWVLAFGVAIAGKFILPRISSSPVLSWASFLSIVAVVLWFLYRQNAKRRDSL